MSTFDGGHYQTLLRAVRVGKPDGYVIAPPVVLTETLEAFNDVTWAEPPPLNWSTVMFRKRRTTNGKQATEARRDCLEVTIG